MLRPFYLKIVKKATLIAALAGMTFFVIEPAMAVVPNDPLYSYQAEMWNQINAPAAWDYATGSKRIVVAMIDTGMDIWHEDLRDNLWVNGEEIPGNGIDDDHNGYVDDVNGWNFVENNNDIRTSVFDVADDKEAVRHGTLVGGQVGARGDNGLDGTGINWRVSLMPLRAIRSDGKGSTGAVARAVDYAVDNGADVISLSFMGEEADPNLLDALRRARKKGIVIIAAAGNYDIGDPGNGNLDVKPLYPACYDYEAGDPENWILAVGSVDKNDALSKFSYYGKCIDIMAPGEYVYNVERYAPEYGYPNEFGGPWFGTSFAAPLVAGAAALIKSLHPEWTAREIIQDLLSTVDPIDALNPEHAGALGRGRLNIGRAISLAFGTPIKKAKGSIYFTKNTILWKIDLGSGRSSSVRPFSGVPVAVNAYAHYNVEQAAALLNRNGRYFLDVYRDDGRPVEESAIPKSAVFGRSIIKFSSGIFAIVSKQYNKRTQKSKVAVFNIRSRHTKALEVSGEIASLSVADDGNLNLVLNVNKKFNFVSLNSNGDKIFSIPMPGIINVLANETANGKTALVVQRGNRIVLQLVDLEGGDTTEQELSAAVAKHWFLKVITMAEKSFFLPYTTEGGSFAAYDSDLRAVLTVRVPKQ